MKEPASVEEAGKQLADAIRRNVASNFTSKVSWDASFVLDLLKLTRSRDFRRLPSPPPVKQWLRLYRSHRAMADDLGYSMKLPHHGLGSLSSWADLCRLFPKLAEKQQQELMSSIDHSVLTSLLYVFTGQPGKAEGEIKKAIAEAEPLEERIEVEKSIKLPGIQFLVRVWLPCVCEYQEYPGRLMRRARQGDLDALDKLLRLDKAVVADPRIAEELHQAWSKPSLPRFNVLAKALAGKPNGKLTRGSVKKALGGIIQALTAPLGMMASESQIRAAFDAAAKKQGHLRDRDLPESSEALSKALQRARAKGRLGQKSRDGMSG